MPRADSVRFIGVPVYVVLGHPSQERVGRAGVPSEHPRVMQR